MRVLQRPEPISLDEVNMRLRGSKNTICQELREIYHMVDDEAVRLKIRIAMSMGKRMAKKLITNREERLRNVGTR